MASPNFNPALPAQNSPVSSGELRNQFNGLKFLIDQRAGYPVDITPFDVAFSNPPTQAQCQALQDKLNALLAALAQR
jgi:hypothetical protein